jgi:transcriptional regulator with XRE-family HTH domain
LQIAIYSSWVGLGDCSVRLAEWRDKVAKLTQQQLAIELGCSQPFISLIERAVDPQIPGPEWMIKIYRLTKGDVSPNDFYDLPERGQFELPLEPTPAPLFERDEEAGASGGKPQFQAAA